MIKSIKHKGLEDFFRTGNHRKINADHIKKLRARLQSLDNASVIGDLDLPGYKLHSLKGDRKDEWSISVSGNWRLTFQFTDTDVYLLDYEDYH